MAATNFNQIYIVVALPILLLANGFNGQFAEVTTDLGVIRGSVNSGISVFTAISYGAPPVGNQRFQKPQKAEKWNDVFDATKEGNICMQFTKRSTQYTQSEDCLNLDVYVPRDLSADVDDTPEPLPVLVFIHDGVFRFKSRMEYNSTLLAQRGNMIVVAINYRLGLLGFLALEHDEAPGNVGLMDQILALEWVRDNIRAFGGDPNKVTIYGEGSGSASTSLHLLSPKTKGLFHRAIMNNRIAYVTLPTRQSVAEKNTDKFKALGCDISSPSTILSCLRGLSTTAMIDAFFADSLKPVLDGVIIPDQPVELLTSGKFHRVPVMAGFNSEDGDVLVNLFSNSAMNSGLPHDMVDNFIKTTVQYTQKGLSPGQLEVAAALAKTYYFSNTGDSLRNLRSALDLCRDIYWTAPAIMLARWFSKVGVPVYLYEFDEKLISTSIGGAAIPLGARNGDDILYVFGAIEDQTTYGRDYTPEKLQFVKDLMATWSSLAHTGKPTLRRLDGQTVEWNPYSEENPNYAVLKADMTTTKKNPAPLADMVWNKILGPVKTPLPCPSVGPTEADPNPVVVTESGKIMGKHHRDRISGSTWETYFGVPYADPPIGERRFRKTKPVKPWTGTFNATEFGNSCMQNIVLPGVELPESEAKIKESEDCLNINIWVPGGVSRAKETPLPILFYIHGGGYTFGDNRLDMTGMAVHGNIIVVNVQYRLGMFGFLTTGNSSAPGNFAMWDLLEALEWVKVNGRHFGGDVSKVTVGGLSAGASLATLLMFSPRGRGYFNNVFAMSGSGIASWAIDRHPPHKYEMLLEKVGCDTKQTMPDQLDCLRDVPLSKLVKASKDPSLSYWQPVVDGVLLPDTPHQLRLGSHVKEVNFMGGTILTEGPFIGGTPPAGWTYKEYLIATMQQSYPNSPSVAHAASEFYKFNGTNDRAKFVQSVRDQAFVFGIESIARAMSRRGGKSYVYVASFSSQQRPAIHADDLLLSAGVPLMNNPGYNFTQEQIDLSRNYVNYFSNFVITGNPNMNSSVPTEWPVYDISTKPYLLLTAQMDANNIGYAQVEKAVDFFDNVVPLLVNKGDKCMAADNIVQESYSTMSDNENRERGALCSTENSRQSVAGETGLFNATRKQMDAAVIALMVVSGFLLLLVIILSLVLRNKKGSSTDKSYNFK